MRMQAKNFMHRQRALTFGSSSKKLVGGFSLRLRLLVGQGVRGAAAACASLRPSTPAASAHSPPQVAPNTEAERMLMISDQHEITLVQGSR